VAVSGNQIRAARALAGLEQRQLASASGVSVNTIRNMEARGTGRVRVRLETMGKVTAALWDHRIELTDDNGPGVRLRPAPARAMVRRSGR